MTDVLNVQNVFIKSAIDFTRNRRTPNEILLFEDHAEMILYTNGNIPIVERAIIDLDDVDRVKKYRWHITNGYIRNGKMQIFLHNFIMNHKPTKESIADHKNRKRSDCRKQNLEITTYQKNGINKGKQSNNTSGFPGVSWDKEKKKYESYIKIKRKKKFLGYFVNIEDAIEKRKDAEIKFFGEETNREYDINTVFKKKED